VLGSGDVRITLIWEDMNDLDLAVTDPTGMTIDFDHRFSDSGGALDTDANRNCGRFDDPPRENIFYRTGAAPTGTYNVKVTYFAGCTEPSRPSEFHVELVVDGRARTLLQGTLAPEGTATASFMRSGTGSQ
jgi:Ca-activated chloride channel family protein